MNNQVEGIRYRKNYLKEVIVRVDLLNPLPGVETTLPTGLAEVAVRGFPIAEPRETVQRQVEIGPQGVAQREAHFTEWHFHGRDRTKTLTIGPQVVLVQHKVYETYEFIRDEFIQVLDRLAEVFGGVQSSRVGLRYINEIKLDEPNPADWSHYINPQLLTLLSFPPEGDRTALSRVFQNLELSFDEFNLRYRLGMHNPDFPARIRQKIFILDLDAYTHAIAEIRAINNLLDGFHTTIQRYFEQSITENLRRIMNAA